MKVSEGLIVANARPGTCCRMGVDAQSSEPAHAWKRDVSFAIGVSCILSLLHIFIKTHNIMSKIMIKINILANAHRQTL